MFGSQLFLHGKNENQHTRPCFFCVLGQKRIVQSVFCSFKSLMFALIGRFTEAVPMLLRSSEALKVAATPNTGALVGILKGRRYCLPLTYTKKDGSAVLFPQKKRHRRFRQCRFVVIGKGCQKNGKVSMSFHLYTSSHPGAPAAMHQQVAGLVAGDGREVSDGGYAVACLQGNSQDLCYSPRFEL